MSPQRTAFRRHFSLPLSAYSTPRVPLTYQVVDYHPLSPYGIPCSVVNGALTLPDAPKYTVPMTCVVRVWTSGSSLNYSAATPEVVGRKGESDDPVPIREYTGNTFGMEIDGSKLSAVCTFVSISPTSPSPAGTTEYKAIFTIADPNSGGLRRAFCFSPRPPESGTAAVNVSNDLQAQAAPFVALTRGPGPGAYERLPSSVSAAAFNDSGSRAVIATANDTLLWDAQASRAVAAIAANAARVALSGDGSMVVLGHGGTMDVLSWADPSQARSCNIAGGDIDRIVVSSRGDQILAVTVDHSQVPAVSTIRGLAATGRNPVFVRRVAGAFWTPPSSRSTTVSRLPSRTSQGRRLRRCRYGS